MPQHMRCRRQAQQSCTENTGVRRRERVLPTMGYPRHPVLIEPQRDRLQTRRRLPEQPAACGRIKPIHRSRRPSSIDIMQFNPPRTCEPIHEPYATNPPVALCPLRPAHRGRTLTLHVSQHIGQHPTRHPILASHTAFRAGRRKPTRHETTIRIIKRQLQQQHTRPLGQPQPCPVQPVDKRAISLRTMPPPPRQFATLDIQPAQPNISPTPVSARVQPLHITITHQTRTGLIRINNTTRTHRNRHPHHRIHHREPRRSPLIEGINRDQPRPHRPTCHPARIRLVSHPPKFVRIHMFSRRIAPATINRVKKPQPQRQFRRILTPRLSSRRTHPHRPKELVNRRRIHPIRTQQEPLTSTSAALTH